MVRWQIDNFRFSVLVAPDFTAQPSLWRECVGDEPENSIFQRTTGTKTEIGTLAEAKLTLQIQPMRVDWVHEQSANPGEQGAPRLGPFPDAAGPLLQLARQWATRSSFPDTSRVALGLVLVSSTTDRESGYGELSHFVDVPANPIASDFMYQVNIPRDCRAGVVLRVNRLSRWSVASHRQIVVIRNSMTAQQPIVSPDSFFLRLELDINTDADFEGMIPRDKIPAIIDDLFEGATEICEHGTR